jgi:hypothetical protein
MKQTFIFFGIIFLAFFIACNQKNETSNTDTVAGYSNCNWKQTQPNSVQCWCQIGRTREGYPIMSWVDPIYCGEPPFGIEVEPPPLPHFANKKE